MGLNFGSDPMYSRYYSFYILQFFYYRKGGGGYYIDIRFDGGV